MNGPQSQDGSKSGKTSETDSPQNSPANQGDGQLVVFEVFPSIGLPPKPAFPAEFSQHYFEPWWTALPVVPAETSYEGVSLPDGIASTGTGVLGDTLPAGGAVPEASTWTMTIAGFAAFGLFKRRRIASAFGRLTG